MNEDQWAKLIQEGEAKRLATLRTTGKHPSGCKCCAGALKRLDAKLIAPGK